MLRLATVFSGIGAVEHALDRMGIEHEIVFACDNGDIEILTKEIGLNIDEIGVELTDLEAVINDIKFNDEVEDLYKDQLVAMLKEAKGEYGVLLACLSGLECKVDDKTKETLQQILDMLVILYVDDGAL